MTTELIQLERILRERRHAAAAHHYGAMAAEADKGREYTYTIFRIVAGRYVECQHVGTLASIPDGWSWMKREREA